MRYVISLSPIITAMLTMTFFGQLWCSSYQKMRSAISPRQFFLSRERAVINNKYSSKKAYVRRGNTLHFQEDEFIKKRKIKVRNALEKLFHISLEDKHIPSVAVVCSGGGCRAMLGSLGALSGLQKTGVLDTVMYISTLSGSTWALGLWISTGMPLQQVKKYVTQRLVHNLYQNISSKEAALMGHGLAVKMSFKQPCTTIDLFGAFLANNFLQHFGDDRHMVYLSDQSERIKNGNVPFPIYTAVDGRRRRIGNAAWYEFTPLEIGSADYGVYVPSWAYGRTFKNGVSTNYAPEQSLGFHFGVFGSAFATHAGHMWKRSEHKIKNVMLKSFIDNIFQHKIFANIRIFSAKISNFMFGLKNHEIFSNKQLRLVDAGLECNLPYLPVSGQREERKQDVLIFFDFSKSKIPSALRKAEEYARIRGLKFPVIDYVDIEKRTISIFKDKNDISVPVVIYMPRISDPQLWQEKKKEKLYQRYRKINNFDFETCTQKGFCDTTNFQYTKQQSEQVMDQMEFNVVANKEKILDAIKWVVERK